MHSLANLNLSQINLNKKYAKRMMRQAKSISETQHGDTE